MAQSASGVRSNPRSPRTTKAIRDRFISGTGTQIVIKGVAEVAQPRASELSVNPKHAIATIFNELILVGAVFRQGSLRVVEKPVDMVTNKRCSHRILILPS